MFHDAPTDHHHFRRLEITIGDEPGKISGFMHAIRPVVASNCAQIFQRVHVTTVLAPSVDGPAVRTNICETTRHTCCMRGRADTIATICDVTTQLADDLVLSPLGSKQRPLSEWLTTFHLASVVLDPYTNESSWVLRTSVRILDALRGCHARVNFIVTADEDDTRRFLGPIANDFLVFCDPDRTVVKALGVAALPAFAFIRVDGAVAASAEGWEPSQWRAVADDIVSTTAWLAPTIPVAGDPVAFAGTPATG